MIICKYITCTICLRFVINHISNVFFLGDERSHDAYVAELNYIKVYAAKDTD